MPSEPGGFRARRAIVLLTFATVVAAIVSVARAGASKHAVPVLGHAFYESKGYGHAHPKKLSSGGNAVTFEVKNISWKRWGARRAVGFGTGWYVPKGKPILGGHYEKEKLIVFDLGECNGRRAYRKLSWFFPAHGGHFDAERANTLCS